MRPPPLAPPVSALGGFSSPQNASSPLSPVQSRRGRGIPGPWTPALVCIRRRETLAFLGVIHLQSCSSCPGNSLHMRNGAGDPWAGGSEAGAAWDGLVSGLEQGGRPGVSLEGCRPNCRPTLLTQGHWLSRTAWPGCEPPRRGLGSIRPISWVSPRGSMGCCQPERPP